MLGCPQFLIDVSIHQPLLLDPKDLGTDNKDFDLDDRLGLCWDISTDTLTYQVATTDKPCTCMRSDI